jgi:aldehyde dehydrogenase (NAD+)
MPTIGIETSEQIRTWETAAYAPTRYTELDQQYIGGIWRCGKEGSKLIDTDPFTGETLAEIVQANGTDLDEAYESAAKAQVSWAARNPAERAAIILRSS